DLIADDERQLDGLRIAEMLAKSRPALVRHVLIVTDDPLAELERHTLPLTEVRTRQVRPDVGQLFLRYADRHADGVTDVHSVCDVVERRHLHVEQRAKLGVDFAEPFDRAVEAADPQHERYSMRHEALRRGDLPEHTLADLEERLRQQAWTFDLSDPFHGSTSVRTLLSPRPAVKRSAPEVESQISRINGHRRPAWRDTGSR